MAQKGTDKDRMALVFLAGVATKSQCGLSNDDLGGGFPTKVFATICSC